MVIMSYPLSGICLECEEVHFDAQGNLVMSQEADERTALILP